MKRRIIAMAVCALVLAGCGGGSSGISGISGSIADPALTTANTCHGNGTLQIILMNPNGATISRDMNAPIGDWRGGQCVIPFAFEDTPHLSGSRVSPAGSG
jgi:hypothetical protein